MIDRNRDNGPLLICTGVDFQSFPFGGVISLLTDYLTFFPSAVAQKTYLIGLTTNILELNRLQEKTIGGQKYNFIPIANVAGNYSGSIRLKYNMALLKNYFRLRRLHAGIFYAHSNEIGLALKLFFPTKKVVVHFHGLENPVLSSKFKFVRYKLLACIYDLLCVKLLIKLADKIVINIDEENFVLFSAQYNKYSHKFFRIPPLINENIFRVRDKAVTRGQLGVNSDSKLIIFHGRLFPSKGVDLLINAFKIVSQRENKVELFIIGEGPAKNDLQQLTKSLQLNSKVTFLGQQSRAKIGLYLGCADVFATGTHFEAISVALLEAIACGLPVVTTLVAGVRDVIRNGVNGFYIENRNPEEFAEKLIYCLSDKNDELRRQSIAVASKFRPQKVIPEIMVALFNADEVHSASL